MYRVTVTDLSTGGAQSKELRPGDYVIIATPPCVARMVESLAGGRTHTLVVTDRVPGPADGLWRPES